MQEINSPDKLSFKDDTLHLREEFEKYLYYWKWFVLGIALAITCAYLYLRYTPKQYEVTSTILIHDKENESFSSELSAFKDLGLVANNKSSFDTELGILKSHGIVQKVVEKLDLNISYYRQGRIIKSEVFQEHVPFKLIFFNNDSLIHQKDTLFIVKALSSTQFKLLDSEGEGSATHSFGENIASTMGNFTITPGALIKADLGIEYIVRISSLDKITGFYQHKIQIEPVDKRSSLIRLTLRYPLKQKAALILHTLVEQYNKESIIDKGLIAKNTDIFINERIDAISEELTIVDKDVEVFKSSNQLTDMGSEANLILNTSNALEKEIVNLATQIKLVDYVSEHIRENSDDLIPANLGLTDVALNQSTLKYNEILLERNRILQSSSSLNPVIVNLEDQISKLRTSIAQSLVNLKSSLNISLRSIRNQELRLNSKIISVPKQEREFRDIQRQQQIIETLYLYLLQKREENAITLAVTEPNAKIIDAAYGSNNPVSPKRTIIYSASLLLGLVLPFIGIYLLFLFDNKIHTIEDIEVVLQAPILGDIPITNKAEQLIFTEDDTSPVTESFRMLRTNVYFMLSKIKDASKTIFISSTIKGEGKTFTSINLARVLALSSKKVLLIDGDIRNPELPSYLNIPTREGLTHFLMDASITPETLIEHVPAVNIDVLQSGIIAPNPSELLMNGRFDELLSYAHDNYDYVIVDTAPMNMVTDTLLLSQDKADLFIYIIRASFLDKRMLKIPKKLHESKRLQNMAMLLNGTNPKGVYGYGYGYGADTNKKKWWKRLFN